MEAGRKRDERSTPLILRKAKLSVGDSFDNALAETINGRFKTEVIHRRGPWRKFETAEYATLEWVD